MKYQPGTIVSARGREWTVLPGGKEPLVLLRPLDGTDDEITGILTNLEEVKDAKFELPNPNFPRDNRSCSLLRDALRLGIRNCAGPFRAFGKIGIEPRPYQYVPLMMALKQDPVRILIADDVGVGKTIEAGLIVKELLERGDANGLTVLCPPCLAEQWERELNEKFHIKAELVLSNTIKRLERETGSGDSIFDVYKNTIVSIDFIKSDKNRDYFVKHASNLVVIDEAHTVARDAESNSRHLRHALVEELCDPQYGRNVILLTATPHSGNEGAFRSLLALLDPELADLPEDLSAPECKKERTKIAKHFVQRRREDIQKSNLERGTLFPEREPKENPWILSDEYAAIFDKAIQFANGVISDKSGVDKRVERVRWWGVLSLLRALASSPAAAVATLSNRSRISSDIDESEIEKIGESCVLDTDIEENAEGGVSDGTLGCQTDESDEVKAVPILTAAQKRELRVLEGDARQITGDQDAKMLDLVEDVRNLVREGYSPIVFCRFIQTVDYLVKELRDRVRINGLEVHGINGSIPPEERERRVEEILSYPKRVLVCTDCLSEGINLQEGFNAVIHYDLSWNPTRHEQREGRVDRFGQKSKTVKTITYYGIDNFIDGFILNILLKKHEGIKRDLGVSVPIPSESKDAIESAIRSIIQREAVKTAKRTRRSSKTQLLPGFQDEINDVKEIPKVKKLISNWDNVKVKSSTMYKQIGLERNTEEIENELKQVRAAIGTADDVSGFVRTVFQDSEAFLIPTEEESVFSVNINQPNFSPVLRDYLGGKADFDADGTAAFSFTLPAVPETQYIPRTHPLVEAIADYVRNTALDSEEENPIAGRCGAIKTAAVNQTYILFLLRHRFQLNRKIKDEILTPLAAEEVQTVAFKMDLDTGDYVRCSDEECRKLLEIDPSDNTMATSAKMFLSRILNEDFHQFEPVLNECAKERAEQLAESHSRVRTALGNGLRTEVIPRLPTDVMGVYVYMKK